MSHMKEEAIRQHERTGRWPDEEPAAAAVAWMRKADAAAALVRQLVEALEDTGVTHYKTQVWHQMNCVAWDDEDWNPEDCGPICKNARTALMAARVWLETEAK